MDLIPLRIRQETRLSNFDLSVIYESPRPIREGKLFYKRLASSRETYFTTNSQGLLVHIVNPHVQFGSTLRATEASKMVVSESGIAYDGFEGDDGDDSSTDKDDHDNYDDDDDDFDFANKRGEDDEDNIRGAESDDEAYNNMDASLKDYGVDLYRCGSSDRPRNGYSFMVGRQNGVEGAGIVLQGPKRKTTPLIKAPYRFVQPGSIKDTEKTNKECSRISRLVGITTRALGLLCQTYGFSRLDRL